MPDLFPNPIKLAKLDISQDAVKEAVAQYLQNELSDHDNEIRGKIVTIHEQIDALEQAKKDLQKQCNHPLLFRNHDNYGNGDDYYYTQHHCNVCDMYWRTHQRWKYVGSEKGLPDDDEAKMENT